MDYTVLSINHTGSNSTLTCICTLTVTRAIADHTHNNIIISKSTDYCPNCTLKCVINILLGSCMAIPLNFNMFVFAASIGLISMSARIYGPRSCILTENYVACSSVGDQGHATIKLYSICQQTFGVCLCSVQLRQSIYIT